MSRESTSLKSTSNKKTRRQLKTLKFTPRDSDDDVEPPSKKHRASFALSNPPVFDSTKDDIIVAPSSPGSSSSGSAKPISQPQRMLVDTKGKGKETRTPADDGDNSLWVDKYQPTTEAELAVHKRKVEDVRQWLLEAFDGGPSAKLRKYRRILALTGPAGTAKTATLRVLSGELDFEIVEWRNSMSERGPPTFADGEPHVDDESGFDTETLFDKFQSFLTRAMTCNSIFGHHDVTHRPSLGPLALSNSQAHPSTQRSSRRQLVLLEDLPNLLHQPTQARFQAALRSLCIPTSNLSEHLGPPIVIVVSDSGLRAEQPDDDTWSGGGARRWDKKEVLDIRNILGPDLLTSPYVARIGFNPIAPTLMTKALQALLTSHFVSLGGHGRAAKQPTREVIDIIVASSNGDIRSAIMALQFAFVVELPASSMKSKGKVARKDVRGKISTMSVREILEAVTRREQSLVLFHLMGKILYNKRKFDPPASRLSAKDAAKERELDMQLIDPPPLPVWLSHHNRKASRVCTEALSAESPIDSSLLGMYIHQNYTQFCTDIDQCDGVCEGLSWVDCMGGSQVAYSPYPFRTLTLSTLHALPTPVLRSGQKVCKPSWFDIRTRELEGLDAVGDVLGWLGRSMNISHEAGEDASSVSVGRWTYASVATELGGWLRALDRCNGPQEGHYLQPPGTHRLFSHLPWSLGTLHGDDSMLGENEVAEVEQGDDGDDGMRLPGGTPAQEGKGWLEDDDIEDVE